MYDLKLTIFQKQNAQEDFGNVTCMCSKAESLIRPDNH